jgi:hypothetical protein
VTRERASWLAALVLLVAGWAVAPGAVPLYDGIGFPDEPYRYVVPPPGAAATEPVTSARVVVSVAGRKNQYADTNSGEFGPQVVLHLPEGAMTAAGGATKITVRADPLAPDHPPPDGTIAGNVYRVTADGAASFPARSGAEITLREPVLTSVLPMFVHRDTASAPWRWLATERPGQDFFTTPLAGTGDYALAIPSGTPAVSGGTGGRAPAKAGGGALGWILGGTVGVMALVVVLLRLRRRRT